MFQHGIKIYEAICDMPLPGTRSSTLVSRIDGKTALALGPRYTREESLVRRSTIARHKYKKRSKKTTAKMYVVCIFAV